MTPLILFILSHFLYIQCDAYTKQVTLTPQNPQQQGAKAIILETAQVTATDSSWNIISLNKIGFHMQISLEPIIWGFLPLVHSAIAITIDSNTPMPTEVKLILSASVNNGYQTSIIMLNNAQWNKISPQCNRDTPETMGLMAGDVAALVKEDNLESRLYKATQTNLKVNFADTNVGYDIEFPITIEYSNEVNYNEMFVTLTTNGWTNPEFEQWCRFPDFAANMGFDFYIATNNVGEALNITSITVKYTHLGSGAPSLPPSRFPTLMPTRSPTLNPSNMPTTYQPTNIPTIIPTVNPTVNPTNIPTVNPTNIPTINPTNIPTVNPTRNPSVHPTVNPTIVPTISTNNPTIYPTFNPTKYPTFDPTHRPTYSPTKPQGEADDKTTEMLLNNQDGNDNLSQNNGIFGNTLMLYGVIAIGVLVIVLTCLICIYVFVNKKKKKDQTVFKDTSVQMEKITSVSAQNDTDVNDKGEPNSSEVANNDNQTVLPPVGNSTQTPMVQFETDDGRVLMKNDSIDIVDDVDDENDEEIDEMYASNNTQTIGGNENKITDAGHSDSSDSLQQMTTGQ